MKHHTKHVLDKCTLALTQIGLQKKRRGLLIKPFEEDFFGGIDLVTRIYPGGLLDIQIHAVSYWTKVQEIVATGNNYKYRFCDRPTLHDFFGAGYPFYFEEKFPEYEDGKIVELVEFVAEKGFPLISKMANREFILSMQDRGDRNPFVSIAVSLAAHGWGEAKATYLHEVQTNLVTYTKESLDDYWERLKAKYEPK